MEAAVLLWVADRIHSDLLNAFALIALVLGVARLLFIDDFYSTRLIFNARMATHGLAIAVLAAVAWYASKRGDDNGRAVAAAAIIGLNLLALIALSREVTDYYARQLASFQPPTGQWNVAHWGDFRAAQIMRDFAYSALWMSYGAGLMIVGFWRRSAFVRWQALLLIAATTVKVFAYDVSQLDRAYRILSFIALGVLLLAISFVYQRDWLELSRSQKRQSGRHESDPGMKRMGALVILTCLIAAAADYQASIAFFSNLREVSISSPSRQNYVLVDESLWRHARPDLSDIRLYHGGDAGALCPHRAARGSFQRGAGGANFECRLGGRPPRNSISTWKPCRNTTASAFSLMPKILWPARSRRVK